LGRINSSLTDLEKAVIYEAIAYCAGISMKARRRAPIELLASWIKIVNKKIIERLRLRAGAFAECRTHR